MIEDVDFAYPAGPRLRIRAIGSIRRFFAAEYQWAATRAGSGHPDLEVAYSRVVRSRQRDTTLSGGYKSVRWRVRLSDPARQVITAAIELRGGPLGFGLSLTQGYFVEPLLSLITPGHGQVLLPAAAIDAADGVVVMMGRSRSGKSTVSAGALAAGRRLLGDDQVLVDAHGRCTAFPRRLRLYSDLAETSPAAYRSLPGSARRGLAGRKLVRSLSRGYAAPPMRVPAADLGPAQPVRPLPIAEAILIERSAAASTITRVPIGLEEIGRFASQLLDEQRARISGPRGWGERVLALRDSEEAIVLASLGSAPTSRVLLPSSWSAPKAIAALESVVGVAEPSP